MKDFKKGNRFSSGGRPGGYARPNSGGRPSYGGNRFQSERPSSGGVEMHQATCSKCSMRCEVPFVPNGKKPIYCKNCFVRDDARGASAFAEKRSYEPERSYAQAPSRPPEDHRIGAMQRDIAAMSAKLDTILARMESAAYSSIIAVATGEKPVKMEKAAFAKKAPAKVKKTVFKKKA